MNSALHQKRKNFAMAANRVKSRLAIEVAEKQMTDPKAPQYLTDIQLLRSQINDALSIIEKEKLPRDIAIPEMIKFMIAVDLAANGPTSTLFAIDGIRDQIADIFPKSAKIVENNGAPIAGRA
jgi:hypothetical protein